MRRVVCCAQLCCRRIESALPKNFWGRQGLVSQLRHALRHFLAICQCYYRSGAHSEEVWHRRPVADVLEVGPIRARHGIAVRLGEGNGVVIVGTDVKLVVVQLLEVVWEQKGPTLQQSPLCQPVSDCCDQFYRSSTSILRRYVRHVTKHSSAYLEQQPDTHPISLLAALVARE